MKKQNLFYILLLIIVTFFSASNVYAKEIQEYKIDNEYNINLKIKNSNEMASRRINSLSNNFVQIAESCGGENSILGNVNDPNSVAWLLQKALDYIRVIAPFLVLLLSSIEYLKVVFSSDDDSLAKAHKKLGVRLALAAALFVLPTLVSVLLNILGFTSHEICGLQ